MRVTNGVMVGNMMKNLQKNTKNLDKMNNQIASGKKFENPSENPIGVTNSMSLKSLVSSAEQYERNIDQADDWLTNTESLLGSQEEILQRARELTVYTANDSLHDSDRKLIKEEVGQLREELISIANSRVGDRYLFAGQRTKINSGDPQPFEGENADGIIFNGDHKEITREIGPGVTMAINIDGEEAFKDSIDTLKELEDLLGQENPTGLSDKIGEIDTIIDNNLQRRSEIGAKGNRLELATNRLEDQLLQSEKLLSENEDIDIAEAITNLNMQESVYRASLAVGARVIQPTLVDFIQ